MTFGVFAGFPWKTKLGVRRTLMLNTTTVTYIDKIAGYAFRISEIASARGWHRSARFMNSLLHAFILKCLSSHAHEVISRHSAQECSPDARATYEGSTDNDRLWTSWWQGAASAPAPIRLCLESQVRNLTGTHVVITAENFHEHVSLAPHVLAKHSAGRMHPAHFADYLRVSLLARHGGVWIDASIFASQPFPPTTWHSHLWTRKVPADQDYRNVSDRRWSTFFLGGQSSDLLWKFVVEFLEHYWQTFDAAINYYLLDYALAIAYAHNIGEFASGVDRLEPTQRGLYDLDQLLEQPAGDHTVARVLGDPDTNLFKLAWKRPLRDDDDRPTVYSTLLREYGIR